MLSANFKPKRTVVASRGFLATGRLSCFCFLLARVLSILSVKHTLAFFHYMSDKYKLLFFRITFINCFQKLRIPDVGGTWYVPCLLPWIKATRVIDISIDRHHCLAKSFSRRITFQVHRRVTIGLNHQPKLSSHQAKRWRVFLIEGDTFFLGLPLQSKFPYVCGYSVYIELKWGKREDQA